jgi:hypothetical protein
MRQVIPALRQELQDEGVFGEIYQFAFTLSLEESQKSLRKLFFMIG